MGLRFRRSFRLIPGIRLGVSKPGASTPIGTRGAWFTIGRRGMRATVGIPGTGLSYTERSPWSRPTPNAPHGAPGIEVTELPRVEIDVLPVSEPAAAAAYVAHEDDDGAQRDPRLMPIALLIVALVTAAAVIWAALV